MGSELSQAQLTKNATSLDVGNILKAITIQRGQIKRGPRSSAAVDKLSKLCNELAKRCVNPAQKFLALYCKDTTWKEDHKAASTISHSG